MLKRVVDAVDDTLIACTAYGPEAAVELGLWHVFRQVAIVRQQVGIAARVGQLLAYLSGCIAGGAFTKAHTGTVGGQVGEAEARSLVCVFLFLDQADGSGQTAASVHGKGG